MQRATGAARAPPAMWTDGPPMKAMPPARRLLRPPATAPFPAAPAAAAPCKAMAAPWAAAPPACPALAAVLAPATTHVNRFTQQRFCLRTQRSLADRDRARRRRFL